MKIHVGPAGLLGDKLLRGMSWASYNIRGVRGAGSTTAHARMIAGFRIILIRSKQWTQTLT